MARRMRLIDGDILGSFDSSRDELHLEQSDEDIDFEPDLTENLIESSSSHKLSFSDDGDMEADSVDASTDVGRKDSEQKLQKRGRNSITEGSERLHGRHFIEKISNSKAVQFSFLLFLLGHMNKITEC